MNPDFLDIIRALSAAEVRFLIVGAYAVNLYTDPRATGDLDIWVEPEPENATRLMKALSDFGAPLAGVVESDPEFHERPGAVGARGAAWNHEHIAVDPTGVASTVWGRG